ncbi:DNA-binding protein [Lactobacillus bombi]|nr:DNA-binding protein [Bombilactobacillus bombi]
MLGTIKTGKIVDQNEQYYFVSIAGFTFQLDKQEVKTDISEVQGFLYENQQHHLSLTTKIPQIGQFRYGFGEVVQVRTDLGVFVNIGLQDKDIVVSLDDLPELKSLWPKKGDRLFIAIKIDHKNRMWGQLATTDIFQQISRRPTTNLKNKDVTATVYRLKLSGTFVLTSDYYLGFIHPSEREREPRLGEVVQGRVIGSSFDHLNISLKPRAYEEITPDAEMLLAVLQHQPQGKINFNDKSSPEDIKQYFGISKGNFKRAVGHLLKKHLIIQDEDGIALKVSDKHE